MTAVQQVEHEINWFQWLTDVTCYETEALHDTN